ncbi:MAG: hypothetical protein KDB47_18475, partial [Mycobacterium sp.]|nr:hypothetical protein [Mycobacterium sp.]
MADPVAADLLAAASGVLDESRLNALARCLDDAQPGADPEGRYRRLVTALDRLPASGPGGDRAAGFLGGDPAVLARMSLAAEVMGADGPEVGPGAGHLRRALHWQRYGRGPVSQLHRSCAADIARGSLRLWVRDGGVPVPVADLLNAVPSAPNRRGRVIVLRGQAQLARLDLRSRARMMCTALRADLGRQAAVLSRRQVGAFEDRVRREVRRVAVEFDDLTSRRLTELTDRAGLPPVGPAEPAGGVPLPTRRSTRLEHRLAALLGVGFGLGIALTLGRVLFDLRPDWTPLAPVGCVALGLVTSSWVVGARRLLAERAALERWVVEVVAELRAVLDERVLTMVLAIEEALAAEA